MPKKTFYEAAHISRFERKEFDKNSRMLFLDRECGLFGKAKKFWAGAQNNLTLSAAFALTEIDP